VFELAKTVRALDCAASLIGYTPLYNEFFFSQTWIQMEDLNAPPLKYGRNASSLHGCAV
jgi:hypothetical protein